MRYYLKIFSQIFIYNSINAKFLELYFLQIQKKIVIIFRAKNFKFLIKNNAGIAGIFKYRLIS